MSIEVILLLDDIVFKKYCDFIYFIIDIILKKMYLPNKNNWNCIYCSSRFTTIKSLILQKVDTFVEPNFTGDTNKCLDKTGMKLSVKLNNSPHYHPFYE